MAVLLGRTPLEKGQPRKNQMSTNLIPKAGDCANFPTHELSKQKILLKVVEILFILHIATLELIESPKRVENGGKMNLSY